MNSPLIKPVTWALVALLLVMLAAIPSSAQEETPPVETPAPQVQGDAPAANPVEPPASPDAQETQAADVAEPPVDEPTALETPEQIDEAPLDPGEEAVSSDSPRESDSEGKKPDQGIQAIIDLLKEKGVISNDEAQRLIDRASQEAPPPQPKRIIRIEPEERREITRGVAREIRQEVQEQVKCEIKDEITREAREKNLFGTVPGWVNRIRFGGDLRLRYEGIFFNKNNADLLRPDDPSQLMNTKEDRNRPRIRVRVTMDAKVNDRLDAGIALLASNERIPVSDYVTMGTAESGDGYWSMKKFLIHEAWLKWRPWPELTLWGGKMVPPFLYTNLLWDYDLRIEGAALQYDGKFFGKGFRSFVNLGIFPLQEEEFSDRDKWMTGGQVGLGWSSKNLWGKLGLAYYDFHGITGVRNTLGRPNEFDFTAPRFQQKGNTLMDIDPGTGLRTALASDFNEVNVTSVFDIGHFHPVHVNILADWVCNLGYDRAEVISRVMPSEPLPHQETDGYHVGVTIGYPTPRDWAEWQLFGFYKHIGADCVVDAFNDSDFHLGGTNAKGWIIGGELGLGKNWWSRVRWLTADEIQGPPLSIDLLQVDLNTCF